MSSFSRLNSDPVYSLTAAITGMVIAPLYIVMLPLAIGNFADILSISEDRLGLLVTTFMIGYVFSATSGLWWLRYGYWRRISALAFIVLSISFAMPALLIDYTVLLTAHLVGGLAAGFLSSICTTRVAEARNASRAFAILTAAQTLTGVVLAFVLPSGADGYKPLLYALSLSGLVGLLAVPFLSNQAQPKVWDHPAAGAQQRTLPISLVFVALAALFLPFMGEISAFTFLSEIARVNDLSREYAQKAISYGLIICTLGSVLAGFVGLRFGRIVPILTAFTIEIFAFGLYVSEPGAHAFFTATLLLYGAWGFCQPYRLGLIADVDATGRFAPLIVTAQFGAVLVGPGISGLLLVGGDYNYGYAFWITLLIAGLVLSLVASAKLRARSRQW